MFRPRAETLQVFHRGLANEVPHVDHARPRVVPGEVWTIPSVQSPGEVCQRMAARLSPLQPVVGVVEGHQVDDAVALAGRHRLDLLAKRHPVGVPHGGNAAGLVQGNRGGQPRVELDVFVQPSRWSHLNSRDTWPVYWSRLPRRSVSSRTSGFDALTAKLQTPKCGGDMRIFRFTSPSEFVTMVERAAAKPQRVVGAGHDLLGDQDVQVGAVGLVEGGEFFLRANTAAFFRLRRRLYS